MGTTTREKLVTAIEALADKIGDTTEGDDALKYTQALLNAAEAAGTLWTIEREEKADCRPNGR